MAEAPWGQYHNLPCWHSLRFMSLVWDILFSSVSTKSLFADHGVSTRSETDPSVVTIQLIGSWDNFSACYPMERDVRRGRGHWRGCHSLQDHVCDGAGSRYKMHTGLAMGRTYYYYLGPPRRISHLVIASLLPNPDTNMAVRTPVQYEVNGSAEMCDPAMPSTTTCPYLPGQKVNTLYIPEEGTSRIRRASLSSLSDEPLRTMDPGSKFVAPQPAAPSHADLCIRRIGTAAPALSTTFPFPSKDPSRSITSPTKSSWKRFFNKTLIIPPPESRGRSISNDDHRSLTSASSNYDIRPQTASEGTRTRDISPASLRRFLVEEMGTSIRPVSRGSLGPSVNPRALALDVLDQVDEEDDDYFGGNTGRLSAVVAEEPQYMTRLSPPPFKRGISPATATSSSAQTVVPSPRNPQPTLQTGAASGLLISPVPRQPLAQLSMPESSSLSTLDTTLQSACPSSTLSSAMNSPASPTSGEFPTFYDESQDDDDIDERFPFSSRDEVYIGTVRSHTIKHVKAPSTASFSRYRLPQLTFSTGKLPAADSTLSKSPRFTTVTSPMLLPQSGEPTVGSNGGSNLLGSSLDIGLDDFATELSWMADSITTGH
ncbi:hypothetical protein PWT90_09569 [Aphanocladium album]|nr:hypothetical protein PWT90_09569 [Aphanocladium album]